MQPRAALPLALAALLALAACAPAGSGGGPNNPGPVARQQVLSVQQVTLRTARSYPPQILVSANGTAGSGGWTDIALERDPAALQPNNGVVVLNMTGRPPRGPATEALVPVEANLNLGAQPGVVAVRVFSATNDCTAFLDGRPTNCTGGGGVIIGDPAPVPNWIGLRLVRIGQPNPGGNVVLERDIPSPYRIFDPQHTVGDMMYSPDRLNITVDSRDIIVQVTRG